MERIGIAASKIAKGNLLLYNFFVVVITILFSFLIFIISGCLIVTILILVACISSPGKFPDLEQGWMPTMVVALMCLAIIVGIFVLAAFTKNIKFKK